jgi:MFS family permease
VQTEKDGRRWYEGVSGYQWLVLALASLGWVFDVFEGQIFVASMREAMPALLGGGTPRYLVAFYDNIALAAFLVGGAVGGVLFGVLGDRVGRKRALTWTILTYSVFTCLSAFARTWWQMAGCRFLVALGVGGEWAVASALVAEVFPLRSRAWAQSIFHASSVLGTYLAVAAGTWVVAYPTVAVTLPGVGTWQVPGWRLGFLLGVLPALLIVWVRVSLREPDAWLRAHKAPWPGPPSGGQPRGQERPERGSIIQALWGVARAPAALVRPQARRVAAADLTLSAGSVWALFTPGLRRRTLVGVGLATVGLATFWGTHIYGKNVLREAVAYAPGLTEDPDATTLKRAEMLGMFLVTTGGGLGLLSFGPLSEWLGRRRTFLVFLLGGLASSLVLFSPEHWGAAVEALYVLLPVFGFLTLGMHAGFAVYFPELFPTRLRSTGGGFCFNVGRLLAAPVLVLSGWLQKELGSLGGEAASAALLSLLFLPGALLLLIAPETRGRDLPE